MTELGPFFWPTLEAFGAWIDRNCTNCRWKDGGLDGPRPNEACPLPKLGWQAMIHGQPTPIHVIAISCEPAQHPNMIVLPRAPYKCYSRIDKRGRPRKTSNG
jgi:hypothetical protein